MYVLGGHAISIELGSVLILIVVLFKFCLGHVENGSIYTSTRILLDRTFGSILIWGNNIDCFGALEDEF